MFRPTPKNLLAAGAVASLAALCTAGCADNDSMLFVRAVLASTGGDCVVSPDPTSLQRPGGTLDLAFRSNYVAPLLVGNQLVQRGNRDQLRTESSRIVLRGAIIEVLDPQGNSVREFTTDGTGFVDPGDGTEPGYGIMSVELIPPGLLGVGRYNVGIRVFGDTLGGTEIESAQLTFPITVCQNCLVSFPSEAIDPTTNSCGGDQQPSTDPPCAFGQDDAIDCRFCVARFPNECGCPAPPCQ